MNVLSNNQKFLATGSC